MKIMTFSDQRVLTAREVKVHDGIVTVSSRI